LRGRGHGRTERIAQCLRNALSRASALLALLAILNVALAPLAQAAAPPRAASIAEVAASLKSTFGDAFVLCVNADGDGSQPGAPLHHGDGECPLCGIHATVALVAPDAVRLSIRRDAAPVVFFRPEHLARGKAARASPAQPRAPPALA